jgi:hypothetical protein
MLSPALGSIAWPDYRPGMGLKQITALTTTNEAAIVR